MEGTRSDGRWLAWRELGDRDGIPVLALHGIAASHEQFSLFDGTAAELGVRLVAIDRPGYGQSDLHPDRALSDAADDATAIADHLGVVRFGVVGVSAGGPNALAIAHGASERVLAVAAVSSVGPRQQPQATGPMLPMATSMFALARRSPLLVRPGLAGLLRLGRRWPGAVVTLRARSLPEVDRRVLERPSVRALYERELATAPRTAAVAAAQDLGLLARRWDFDPAEIVVRAHLFHGAQDGEAPWPQAQALSDAIPDAILHRRPDSGHLAWVDAMPDALVAAADLDDPPIG